MPKLNEDQWFFIVRIGSSERLINKSGDINVCLAYHLPKILAHLNRYAEVWEGMSIANYKETFGEYMRISNVTEYVYNYTNDIGEESEYYD